MTLDHKSGSQDIAAYYANLRSGDMAQCDEPETRTPAWGWMVFYAAVFAFAGGVALGLLTEVPEYYTSPRGYGACVVKGC